MRFSHLGKVGNVRDCCVTAPNRLTFSCVGRCGRQVRPARAPRVSPFSALSHKTDLSHQTIACRSEFSYRDSAYELAEARVARQPFVPLSRASAGRLLSAVAEPADGSERLKPRTSGRCRRPGSAARRLGSGPSVRTRLKPRTPARCKRPSSARRPPESPQLGPDVRNANSAARQIETWLCDASLPRNRLFLTGSTGQS